MEKSRDDKNEKDSFIKSVPWLYLFLQTLVFLLMVLFLVSILVGTLWMVQKNGDFNAINQTGNLSKDIVGSMVG